MKTTTFAIIALLVPICSQAKVIYERDSTLRVDGEQVYKAIKNRIEIPDEEFDSLPRFEMGKEEIPVTITDAINLANDHFKKTLGVPFTERNGFIEIELTWTGGLANAVWWYHIRFRPFGKTDLVDPERWDYQLGIPMNRKVYEAEHIKKEIVDTSDPLKESGIPFLIDGRRDSIHPIEHELQRLRELPDLESDGASGVYLHKDGNSAYVFYPDGNLFTVHTADNDLYKLDDQGRVFTTYVFGPMDEKISSDTYIGIIKHGKFIRDHGDYHDVYYRKEEYVEPVDADNQITRP